jgi:hypothetical protein
MRVQDAVHINVALGRMEFHFPNFTLPSILNPISETRRSLSMSRFATLLNSQAGGACRSSRRATARPRVAQERLASRLTLYIPGSLPNRSRRSDNFAPLSAGTALSSATSACGMLRSSTASKRHLFRNVWFAEYIPVDRVMPVVLQWQRIERSSRATQ